MASSDAAPDSDELAQAFSRCVDPESLQADGRYTTPRSHGVYFVGSARLTLFAQAITPCGTVNLKDNLATLS